MGRMLGEEGIIAQHGLAHLIGRDRDVAAPTLVLELGARLDDIMVDLGDPLARWAEEGVAFEHDVGAVGRDIAPPRQRHAVRADGGDIGCDCHALHVTVRRVVGRCRAREAFDHRGRFATG